MSIQSPLRTKIIIFLGVFGASFSAILVRYSSAPPMVLVFYRISLAALIMTVPGLRKIHQEREIITKKDLLCCLISGIFLALHFNSYFTSLKHTSITAAVVLADSEVFFVSFIMMFFFKEKLTKRSWMGIVIAFLGSVIIAIGDMRGSGGSLVGDLWALSGALFVGIYTIMGRMCRKHMSTGSYTTIVYWSAAIISLLLLVLQRTPVLGYSLSDMACAFGMTILCTLLGHSVFSWGLKFLSPAFISTAKLLEPVFASILGILLFSEIPSLSAVLGGAIVITGIWMISRSSS